VFCLYRADLDALEVSVLAGTEQSPVKTIVHRGEGLAGRVWDSGQPLIVNEYARWGARAAILADHPWTAMMCVPVRYGDQFLGTLGVATEKQRSFSPEDAEFLSLLARQAAIAIRNARLVQALQESEDRYRIVSELTSDFAYAMRIAPDGKATVEWLAGAFSRITGYTMEELGPVDAWRRILHPDDWPVMQKRIKNLYSGKPDVSEYRVIRKSGEERWLLDRARPEWSDGEGRAIRMIGAAQDITEQRQAEIALRESEERSRSIFEQAAVGIAHVSIYGRFIRINQRFCDIVGYSQEEMLARTFQEITYPDDLDADLKYVNQILRGEIPTYSMEKRYMRRDRSLVWVNLTVSYVRETTESAGYFISVVEDISERKRAEEALRGSEAKYRALVEASPDAIIVTSLDGAMTSANSQTARMHGFASVEEMRSSVSNGLELISPPDRPRALEMMPKIMSEGAARLEGLLLRRDGSTFPGEWHTASFTGESGAPVLIHVVHDITERKRAEEKLLRYAKRLESLHEIDRAILASWAPEEIATAALTHIHELLRCQWAAVALYDYASGQATLLAVKISQGASLQVSAKIEKGAQLSLNEIKTLDVLRQGNPIIHEDAEGATDLSLPGRLLVSQGLRSYMVVPLIAQAELMGCLMLGSSYPRAFDTESLQIAKEVASSQAVALRQARLYQQLQADRQQLEMLSMRLLEVQETERRHIARELHDQIGQMLTGLS
jgi:PAS domain S-box-containing protein